MGTQITAAKGEQVTTAKTVSAIAGKSRALAWVACMAFVAAASFRTMATFKL